MAIAILEYDPLPDPGPVTMADVAEGVRYVAKHPHADRLYVLYRVGDRVRYHNCDSTCDYLPHDWLVKYPLDTPIPAKPQPECDVWRCASTGNIWWKARDGFYYEKKPSGSVFQYVTLPKDAVPEGKLREGE